MGSFSEYVAFLNAEKLPSKTDCKVLFTHIDITPELIRERRNYRNRIKQGKKIHET